MLIHPCHFSKCTFLYSLAFIYSLFEFSRSNPSFCRYYPGPGSKVFEMHYQLPKDLTCRQCVFQWRYVAGNNWGKNLNFRAKIDKTFACSTMKWIIYVSQKILFSSTFRIGKLGLLAFFVDLEAAWGQKRRLFFSVQTLGQKSNHFDGIEKLSRASSNLQSS